MCFNLMVMSLEELILGILDIDILMFFLNIMFILFLFKKWG